MQEKYDHREIEKKWQKKWQEDNLYEAKDEVPTSPDASRGKKENFYTLVEFPYPSGNLHIGHWYAFAVPDIFARTKRMQGYNVMFPIGFDAFGLPAENAAIKHGLDPRKWTYENIAYMEKQLQSMGNSFDWSRKVITAEPEYYKWTQWLFLKLYEKGLAYKKKAYVNWCPKDNTVLANEQVVSGKCERCGTEVVQKDLEQWFFKITDYAERLLSDLDDLKWPEPIKEAQRNWIGKSEGTSLKFQITNSKLQNIEVFTTRVDTLFGVTYLVVAPEHEIISKLKPEIKNWDEVQTYIKETKSKTEIERTDAKKAKTGVKLEGVTVINPANGDEVPVFVADYVLGNYGTGAVMAVPAHDDRDFEFAKKYNLPIKHVLMHYNFDNELPPREGKKDTERDVVHVILRNPKNKTVLMQFLKGEEWGDKKPKNFIIGGIEEGESAMDAAIREVKEETGYKNIKFVTEIPLQSSATFFAAHKDVNRTVYVKYFVFDLIDEARDEITEDEHYTKDSHEIKWIPYEDVAETLTVIGNKYSWKYFYQKEFAFGDDGVLVNSGEFDKMKSEKAREKITEKFGEKVIKYKLRDWLLSRQRYWGCPIPVVYDPEGKPHAIPKKNLPWLLPDDVTDFAPKGESPISTSKELKERVEKIFGKGWKPEVDTMDTFVDSSWYFNRYADPHNPNEFADKDKMKSWLPVKRYSGGAEHTNMHLLYSRFFHKALFDLGLVNEAEPFVERMNRGLILGPDGAKMSKSKGNVVDPDEQVEKVGSDTVKMYLAFIGPYNEVGQYPWDLGGVVGIRRFLERVWKINASAKNSSTGSLESLLHKTIKKVTEDVENYKFNTAISAMMILLNEMEKGEITKQNFEMFLKLLAPFAPHMTEEIWANLGNKKSIHLEEWPKFDASKIKEEGCTIVVQINGKIRAQFEAQSGISEKEAKDKALGLPEIQKWLDGKEVKKAIFVPNKIVNFVV